MNIRSKKLMTYALLVLVIPFVSLMTLKQHDVAAESPTVSITDVTSTLTYRIDVTVEITLTGYNYDLYTQTLYLYLNQSEANILIDLADDEYNGYNSSKTFGRQDEATFETSILSPTLADGSGEDSAKYNVTVVAITNTEEQSNIVVWSGGYIFIDTAPPKVTFVTPAIGYEEVWGIYEIKANITDISNLSLIQFFVNGEERHRIENPDPAETEFTWDYENYREVGEEPLIKVAAYDNSTALNLEDNTTTVKVVGPSLHLEEAVPKIIDSNETLYFNITITDTNDPEIDLDYVGLLYSIDGGAWVEVAFNNLTIDVETQGQFNYTLSPQPVGTTIDWKIYANNTAGQYHEFKNETYQPFVAESVFPDHILPTGEVEYEKTVTYDQNATVKLNVTEHSVVNICYLNYRIDIEDDFEELALTNTTTGGLNDTWFYFEYNFTETYDVFTIIDFYFWVNDSGGNELTLDNGGSYYHIKVMPIDLVAPVINITAVPETIASGQNITITVTIEETSILLSVQVFYTVNGEQHTVDMVYVSGTTYSASFVISASTGDEVEIFVRAYDEYFNTADSEVYQFEIESAKPSGSHSNAWLWLMLIAVIIIPLAITFVLLKPQK
ncbi:MAG: hypothetical protein ACTSQ0_07460 [Candidatus Heimdallarchaeota archaeon]